ncbi:MAG: hypothetical protein ACE3L7_06105 [Candidatus Pristimantibacillus sp.]
MAIESTSKLVIPGTPLYSLFNKNIGNVVSLATTVGEESGTLVSFSQSYVTITTDSGINKYVLLEKIISFSFTEE